MAAVISPVGIIVASMGAAAMGASVMVFTGMTEAGSVEVDDEKWFASGLRLTGVPYEMIFCCCSFNR